MKEMVEYIVKSIVDSPQQVQVELGQEPTAKVLRISVATADRGKVIGKNGHIIKAIRQLVHTGGLKRNERWTVALKE